MTNRTILSTLPAERQEAILTLLARGTRVVAADLARAFDASEDTIRRDLRDLAAAGLCRRVYGGALPVSPASGSLETRENEARERKGALGRAAARLARAGSTLFIDAGTTNLAIARALPVDLGLTVVTNAPSLAAAIAGTAGLELVLIGGRVDPRSGAALGARAFRDASEIRVDLAFLGACAVDAEAGVAAFGAEEAEFKRLVASSGSSRRRGGHDRQARDSRAVLRCACGGALQARRRTGRAGSGAHALRRGRRQGDARRRGGGARGMNAGKGEGSVMKAGRAVRRLRPVSCKTVWL